MTEETHLTLVLSELTDGLAKTTAAVANATGLSIKQASRRINELRNGGMVALVGTEADTGHRLYQLARAAEAARKPRPEPKPQAAPRVSGIEPIEEAPPAPVNPSETDVSRLLLNACRQAQEALDAYIDHLAEADPVLRHLLSFSAAVEAANQRNH